MKTYNISCMPPVIRIGYDGENNWRPQAFDCTPLLQNHSNGTITLWILPEGETQAFPVALTRDGNTVIWTPLSEEMTAATGALQIVCTDGTDVGKSAVVLFRVDESVLPGADHPAAVPSWATQVMEQMQSAVEHYPQIIDSTWHVWDVENEIWEDTGVSAQGVDGEDGHSPYIALNGHWMVYSDATGEWIDTGVSAAVDEAVIANAVAAYLDEHPIQVTETDPTVPQWAKQPTKPTYTAQEVGALPSSYTPPVQSVNGKTGAVVLGAADVHALPDTTPIPPAVTEQTVSGWGFTKNTGTYSKPSGGIPAGDLAAGVIPAVPVTGVSVNGAALTPQDGVVDVQVPTDYVNTGDFEDRTGSMRIVLSYSNGVVALGQSGTTLDRLIDAFLNSCNVWFLLPTAYITGIPSNTDMMRFWMTGANLNKSAPTVSLTSEYGGKVYHAVLSPVSEYRMEGQLNVYNIALPSAESNSFGGA